MITGNEPAMPCKVDGYDNQLGDIKRNAGGLTIRQYFAANFMSAILSNGVMTENVKRMTLAKGIPITDDAIELIEPFAKLSVDCADILMKELNK